MIRESPGIHVVFHPKRLKLPGLPRIIGTTGGESSIFIVFLFLVSSLTMHNHWSLSVLFSSSSISLARSAKLASR